MLHYPLYNNNIMNTIHCRINFTMNMHNNISLYYCNCIFYTIIFLCFQEAAQLMIAAYITATCSYVYIKHGLIMLA